MQDLWIGKTQAFATQLQLIILVFVDVYANVGLRLTQLLVSCSLFGQADFLSPKSSTASSTSLSHVLLGLNAFLSSPPTYSTMQVYV